MSLCEAFLDINLVLLILLSLISSAINEVLIIKKMFIGCKSVVVVVVVVVVWCGAVWCGVVWCGMVWFLFCFINALTTSWIAFQIL